MNTNLFPPSRHRYITPGRQPLNESASTVNERNYMIQLRRRRTGSTFSFYDNNAGDEDEVIKSKWTIVRQRLPDILAFSKTYKPTSIRAQLVLLVALTNRQSNQLRRLSNIEYSKIPARISTNVIINIDGRNRLISLKRIPPEQTIYVDVDDLSFSIPTRQFIIAISHGYAQETAAKYCPPAISDMLIDLSKTKFVDDRKQYKRALFKMRIGQILFFVVFIFIIGMLLALMISSANTLLKLNSFNHTNPNISTTLLSSRTETEEYVGL